MIPEVSARSPVMLATSLWLTAVLWPGYRKWLGSFYVIAFADPARRRLAATSH